MEEQNLPVKIDREYITTWLRYLLYAQIASVAISAISTLLGFGTVFGWIVRILSAGVVFILLRMIPVNEGYRTAAIFHGIVLAGGIFSVLSQQNTISLVISVCSIIARYQEYHAHSELCEGKDPALAQKWRSLFIWQMVIGLVIGFITTAGTVIGVVSGAAADSIVNVILVTDVLVSTVLEVVYLLYLKRTISLYSE